MKSQRLASLLAVALLAAWFPASDAWAHGLSASYSELRRGDDALHARVKMQAHDVLAVLGIPGSADPERSIRGASREIVLYTSNRFDVQAGGRSLEPLELSARYDPEEMGWALVDILYRPVPGDAVLGLASSLLLETDPAHVHFSRLGEAESARELTLRSGVRGTFGAGGAGADLSGQVRRYAALGIEHILIGTDHILFLLGLLLVSVSFAELLKIVTSFTIAHSATLLLATLGLFSLPGRLVESLIALSIVYVAVENLGRPRAGRRWLLAFGFGLVHGFGFSGVLVELGLPATGLAACVLSFNLGVELGQVAIVAIAFPLLRMLSRWRHHDAVVVRGGSVLVGLAGAFWFVQRAFGS